MGPAASGSLLRDNHSRHSLRRHSFLRWTAQTPRRCVLAAPSAKRPKATISLASMHGLVFACLRLPGRGLDEDHHILLSFLALNRTCLRVPSETRLKVVSPTVAPRSLGPNLREGHGFDLVGAGGARSATLQAGRRSGDWRSTVRAVLQKMLHIFAEETKFLELDC